MQVNTLPIISKSEIDAAAAQGASELIYLLTSRYREQMNADQNIFEHFTMEQNVLLAYDAFDGQVSNGGFLQLIENKFGGYIFDTPLSGILRQWGAIKTADTIDAARPIYEAKKEVLEREKTLQEFALLYQEHTEFETLDDAYYQIADAERDLIKAYILLHLIQFATIS